MAKKNKWTEPEAVEEELVVEELAKPEPEPEPEPKAEPAPEVKASTPPPPKPKFYNSKTGQWELVTKASE